MTSPFSVREEVRGIPFVRVFPSGHRQVQTIVRDARVMLAARMALEAGVRYVIRVAPDLGVELVAVVKSGPERTDLDEIASRSCANDAELPEAVDELVMESHRLIQNFERRT